MMELSPAHREILLQTAAWEIRRRLGDAASASAAAEYADPALSQPAGCFVSLHEGATHALRGCVGRLDASLPLLTSLRQAAISCLEDPRFAPNPVTLEELPRLEIEISILGPLKTASHPLDFDLLNDGIYLSNGSRAGCFLPQVARETGWNKEQLLNLLCTEKLGLPADAWRDPWAKLQVFRAVIFGPIPFPC